MQPTNIAASPSSVTRMPREIHTDFASKVSAPGRPGRSVARARDVMRSAATRSNGTASRRRFGRGLFDLEAGREGRVKGHLVCPEQPYREGPGGGGGGVPAGGAGVFAGTLAVVVHRNTCA